MIGMVALKKRGNVGSPCVIIEKIDETFVTVDDGNKKQRVNISHLEFVEKSVSVSGNIRESLLGLGYDVREKKQVKAQEKKPDHKKEPKPKAAKVKTPKKKA